MSVLNFADSMIIFAGLIDGFRQILWSLIVMLMILLKTFAVNWPSLTAGATPDDLEETEMYTCQLKIITKRGRTWTAYFRYC